MAVFFYVISILISTAAGRCITGNRGGVEVVYHGEGCDCARALPFQVEVPLIQRDNYIHRDHGYRVEVPVRPAAKVKYAFDVEVEKPINRKAEYSLGSYEYQIEVPDRVRDNTRYVFDYKVEVPVERRAYDKLENLYTEVDRIMVPKGDCQSKACTCRGPSPSIDVFRACPKHGHRYRSVRGLAPTGYRTRYVQTEPQIYATDEYVDSMDNSRRKRQVSETNDIFTSFIKTTDTLLGSIKPTVQTIASTLQALLSKAVEEEDHFISKRATITDEKIAELQESVNVEADIEIEKEIIEAENSTADTDDKVKYSCPTVASLKLSGNTDLLDRPEVLQYLPEVGDSEPVERTRKDCQACGHKGTTHYPCPKCGYIHPAYGYPDQAQYHELMDGMPVAYTPGQLARSEGQVEKMRPIYDRLGHQYVENPETGNLRLITPKSANYDYDIPQNPYNELHHILDNYQEYLHDVNSHSSGTGLTDSPVNIVLDAIKFMSDATLHHNGKASSDHARSAGDDAYEIDDLNAFTMNGKFQPTPDMMYSSSDKSSSSSGPVKRSFKFTPISQDETDGSVLVRISPTKATQEKLKQFGIMPSPTSYKRAYHDDDVQQIVKKERKTVPSKSGGRPTKKISRNGKQYEILTLNDDFSMFDEDSAEFLDVDDINYDEDNAELLKYIYRAQQATNGPRRTDNNKLRATAANLNDDNFAIEDYDSSVQFA